jgi:hypothetical protein
LFVGKNGESCQAFGTLVGIGMEQNAVDDAENGCRRAHPEGQRENCSDGEAGGLAKLAESEATVQENRMPTVRNAFLADHARILAPSAKEFPYPAADA